MKFLTSTLAAVIAIVLVSSFALASGIDWKAKYDATFIQLQGKSSELRKSERENRQLKAELKRLETELKRAGSMKDALERMVALQPSVKYSYYSMGFSNFCYAMYDTVFEGTSLITAQEEADFVALCDKQAGEAIASSSPSLEESNRSANMIEVYSAELERVENLFNAYTTLSVAKNSPKE